MSAMPAQDAHADGTANDHERFDVVVVGAGPVGAALVIDLAMAGVSCLLLERRGAAERPHPGTNLTNMRSMEHLRRWGATEHVRAANRIGPEFARDAQFPTRGNGHMMAKIPGAFGNLDPLPFSSASPHFGPQATVEQGLRARLAELPEAEVRFECGFERFEDRDSGIAVVYCDSSGTEHRVEASYLVGADGSGSRVRKQLGIRMEGTSNLADGTAWYVHSPEIRDLLREHLGSAVFVWFTNEDRNGVLLIAQDSDGTFQYMSVPLEEGADGGDWEQMRGRLHRAVGAELPVEPLEGGAFWINSLVAPRFHEGRVFLAGEAAHHISVVGGFGMNTGISDAADLGWKLTAQLRGWAGPDLLDSYDAERVPVCRWVRDMTEESTKHLGDFVVPGMEEPGAEGDALREQIGQRILEDKRKEVVSFGAQFGAAYYDSPVILSDGTRPPGASFGEFTPSASPGARAPHAWLGDGRSLFDEVALEGFTLLRFAESTNVAALVDAAASRGVPLRCVTVEDPELQEAYGGAALVLIRPDHYVAWRTVDAPTDALAIIDGVRGAGRTSRVDIAPVAASTAPVGV